MFVIFIHLNIFGPHCVLVSCCRRISVVVVVLVSSWLCALRMKETIRKTNEQKKNTFQWIFDIDASEREWVYVRINKFRYDLTPATKFDCLFLSMWVTRFFILCFGWYNVVVNFFFVFVIFGWFYLLSSFSMILGTQLDTDVQFFFRGLFSLFLFFFFHFYKFHVCCQMWSDLILLCYLMFSRLKLIGLCRYVYGNRDFT